MADPFRVGFLLFPDVTQLDMTGPWEVLSGMPDTETRLVWKIPGPVPAKKGLTITADTGFAECPQLDLVCVPGGPGMNALLTDDEVLDFLRRQAAGARYVTSVCTGALVLGAAGLLRGKRATTHWRYHDLLAAFGAIPTQGRVVRDGNLFTGGGVTAGIDFALTLAAELVGPQEAETVGLMLEYAPAPPFASGRPEDAPASVLAAANERTAAARRAREAIIARLTG